MAAGQASAQEEGASDGDGHAAHVALFQAFRLLQPAVPGEDDEIHSGSTCIVVTTAEARPTVERLFKARRA